MYVQNFTWYIFLLLSYMILYIPENPPEYIFSKVYVQQPKLWIRIQIFRSDLDPIILEDRIRIKPDHRITRYGSLNTSSNLQLNLEWNLNVLNISTGYMFFL